MKRIFLLMLMTATVLAWTACDKGNEEDNGGTDKPASPYYEFPLNVGTDGFDGGNNGVTINVSDVQEQNIIFNVAPSTSIASYKLAVYPKALIYNLLLNEGLVDADQQACSESIIALLDNAALFTQADEEYSVKEFDWANSIYSEGDIVPDCDYFIIALGCYDTAGQNPASLSIAQVTTTHKPIIGDPHIDIETEAGYSAFIVRYHPNEDCKYFYHWIWKTSEIKEFIKLFGERMMRDFCRSALSTPLDASLSENLAIKQTFEPNSDIDRSNTVVAVAADENLTPSRILIRSDFDLNVIPEGDFTPVARIQAGERIGATLAYLDVEMERNCMSCFYRIYTAEEGAQIKTLSADEQKIVATSIANEGWGVANYNFSFDTETETLKGDAFKTSDEVVSELKPETKYVVAYVAKNYFSELSELYISEPFSTKTLTRDNPDACEADINLYFTNISRWGFTFNFEYDYSKIAAFRFQLVWPYDADAALVPPHYIDDRDNREKWMTFFYDTYITSPAGFDTPIANVWTPEKSGYDGYSMYGYDSGVTYVFAYCAEDLNGNVGPVQFVEVATTEANPGPNPEIKIMDIAYDDTEGGVTGRFEANEDTKMIKYLGVTADDASLFTSCALNDLVNGKRRDYDAYMTLWESQIIQLGLSSNAESISFGVNCEKVSDSPVLIAAVAIGEENGEDVYSTVACKIYHKGEFKDLSDYRTPPTE